jgi:hypothetical protein
VVSPISSSAGAVTAAWSRYDRAAGAVVAATIPDGAAETGDITGAIVEMDQSRIQVMASLLVMRKSNEALAAMLDGFDYDKR